jgi:Na+/H+ antiporter NhaD/arsenite permease-like protein
VALLSVNGVSVYIVMRCLHLHVLHCTGAQIIIFFLIYTMSQMFKVIVFGDSCTFHLSGVS